MIKKYWLYLEPYVHVSVKREHTLIYNPLNKKVLEYKNNPQIAGMARRLQSMKNSYVIKLTSKELENPQKAKFVEKLRESFMGDLLDSDWVEGKPLQIMPNVRVMKDSPKSKRRVETGNEDGGFIGMELMSYLSEISLYINNGNRREHPVFNNAYRQFLFPYNGGKRKTELPLQSIKDIVNEAKGSSLFRLNILGGNIFEYPDFKKLNEFLNTIPVIKTYFVYYRDLRSREDALKSIHQNRAFDKAKRFQWELDVSVDFPVREELFLNVVKMTGGSGLNTKFYFILEDETEFEEAENLAVKFNLTDYSFQPYYNGKNLDFFNDTVFLTREDVLESNSTQKDIFARMEVNQTDFGKLTILSNGNIHSNVNSPALGKLGKDSLFDVVDKEIRRGRNWRRTRQYIIPCRRCVFQYLCPSPSNYEYAVGKNNLCHIRH